MRKTIAQNFYNCFICNDIRATNCLKEHLNARNIEQEQCINDWKAYIINLSMPYAYGYIEGKGFTIQWICELLDVKIYIWNTEMKDISLRFYSSNTCSKLLYLMHLPISTSHVHYHALLQIQNVENINHDDKIPEVLQRIS